MTERNVERVVISVVHLGTYCCHARELLDYLRSVRPKILVLNGDIIDIWQFSKRYWPDSHMEVIRKIMKFITEDVRVCYLTGNHDEMLRKFRSEEHTSELQSLMRTSYAVFCLKKKKRVTKHTSRTYIQNKY